MTDITILDKTPGDALTAEEFQQILDALKKGTRSINTEELNACGFITGKKIGVHAYVSVAGNTTITSAGTYYPINATFVNEVLESFAAAVTYTPGIKYNGTLTQYFEIDWHATVKVDAVNTIVTCGIKKNGTLITGSDMSTMCRVSAEAYALSGTAVVELAEDDEIQLVVTSDDNGDMITIDKFTTTIREFFS